MNITLDFSVRMYNFDVEGTISGWYTAAKPSKKYQSVPISPPRPSRFDVLKVEIRYINGRQLDVGIVLDAVGQTEFEDAHKDYIRQLVLDYVEEME